MIERELILYAWPTGPLADAAARYFEVATERLGPTTAQTYPVHCTLTGFFRRHGARGDEVVAQLNSVLAAHGTPDDVVVERLGRHDGWVGLELTSPGLLALIDLVVDADVPTADEDALRPKDWLHVSLAYGVDDVGPYAALAEEMVDPTAAAGWEVGFWERLPDGAWRRL